MADQRPPPPRRTFFRDALRSLLDGVDEVVQWQKEQWTGALPRPAPPRRRGTRLRPPGALQEDLFRTTCQRSGECVAVCPVRAIQITHSPDPAQDGTPFLIAQEQACVVCQDLSCMRVCPSGALRLVPQEEIRMGLALVDDTVCRRSFQEECTECVDRCPLGEAAIQVGPEGRITVHEQGCVGCGVCEYFCPTSPIRAIRILPL